jgi:A/G-specific adenine glycosylase
VSPRPVALHERVTSWYAANARVLPWRLPGVTPWGVLVSEVMLQQTPVVRVTPAWEEWMRRWPRPADLAAEEPGEAVRAWARLGYPRRALRLHAAAGAITAAGGELPDTLEGLRALPGVGEYTAAAVASWAFGQRHVVLDTNIRRVLARVAGGNEFEPAGGTTKAERVLAAELLPHDDVTAVAWNIGLMELGALVCGARNARCQGCPLAGDCAWLAAGRPAWDGPARTVQTFAGTDRQVRGRLLAVVRDAVGPVGAAQLVPCWPDDVQRDRALAGLVADGLVRETVDGYALP